MKSLIEIRQTANTINSQLMINRQSFIKVLSWGIRNKKFDVENDMVYLQFMVSGRKFKGWVKILLNEGADSYIIKFSKTAAGDIVKEFTGIYAEQLTDIIDEEIEKSSDYKF